MTHACMTPSSVPQAHVRCQACPLADGDKGTLGTQGPLWHLICLSPRSSVPRPVLLYCGFVGWVLEERGVCLACPSCRGCGPLSRWCSVLQVPWLGECLSWCRGLAVSLGSYRLCSRHGSASALAGLGLGSRAPRGTPALLVRVMGRAGHLHLSEAVQGHLQLQRGWC